MTAKTPNNKKNVVLENYGCVYKLALFPTVFRIGWAHRIGIQWILDLTHGCTVSVEASASVHSDTPCLCPSLSPSSPFSLEAFCIFQVHGGRINSLKAPSVVNAHLFGGILLSNKSACSLSALGLPNEMQGSSSKLQMVAVHKPKLGQGEERGEPLTHIYRSCN